jgi:hypothetical protein
VKGTATSKTGFLLLIEYPKTAERQALSKKLAKENGLVWLATDRQPGRSENRAGECRECPRWDLPMTNMESAGLIPP